MLKQYLNKNKIYITDKFGTNSVYYRIIFCLQNNFFTRIYYHKSTTDSFLKKKTLKYNLHTQQNKKLLI